jgi:hypothetical protein
MKWIHLNKGLYFERPYESEYSTIRRFLLANPGISMAMLSRILKNQNSGSGFSTRMQSFLGRSEANFPYLNIDSTYKRQCPECAKEFYHSDVYALPWVLRCPIHHCEFTAVCPTCNKEWPNKKMIEKRSCATCGRPLIKDIPSSSILQDKGKYLPIKILYELIQSPNHKKYIRSTKYWLRDEIDISSPLYPSFKLHGVMNQDHEIRKANDIHIIHLYEKSFKLLTMIEYKRQRRELLMPFWDDNYQYRNHRFQYQYETIQEILEWIDKKSTKGHNCYVANHEYLTAQHLAISPKPCPFCIALSIWLFFIVTNDFNKKLWSVADKYPFCYFHGLDSFDNVHEENIVEVSGLKTINNYSYKVGYSLSLLPDHEFSKWLYKRRLKIFFIKTFSFIKSLIEAMDRESLINQPLVIGKPQIENKYYLSDHHEAFVEDNKLTLVYTYENPFDELSNLKFDGDYQCQDYHQHLGEIKYLSCCHFVETINNTRFTYEEFSALYQKLCQHAPYLRWKCSPWYSSKHRENTFQHLQEAMESMPLF